MGLRMSTTDNMSTVRTDLIEKVTGRAEYIADLTVPGMLTALWSARQLIHARILQIDTSAARSVDGKSWTSSPGEDIASFGCWGCGSRRSADVRHRPSVIRGRTRRPGGSRLILFRYRRLPSEVLPATSPVNRPS